MNIDQNLWFDFTDDEIKEISDMLDFAETAGYKRHKNLLDMIK